MWNINGPLCISIGGIIFADMNFLIDITSNMIK